MKVAWGITGCGDRIVESFGVMRHVREKYGIEVHVFLSKAGEQVVKYYKLHDELKKHFDRVMVGKKRQLALSCGMASDRKVRYADNMPCTSNTVAKLVAGIADTMLTNAAIMGVKAHVPCYIMPSDWIEGEVTTTLPDGKPLKLRIRKEDVENIERLRKMGGFTVFESPEEVEDIIRRHLKL